MQAGGLDDFMPILDKRSQGLNYALSSDSRQTGTVQPSAFHAGSSSGVESFRCRHWAVLARLRRLIASLIDPSPDLMVVR